MGLDTGLENSAGVCPEYLPPLEGDRTSMFIVFSGPADTGASVQSTRLETIGHFASVQIFFEFAGFARVHIRILSVRAGGSAGSGLSSVCPENVAETSALSAAYTER